MNGQRQKKHSSLCCREVEVINLCRRLQCWSQQVGGKMDVDSRLGAHTPASALCRKQMASGPLSSLSTAQQLVLSDRVVRKQQGQSQEVSFLALEVSWWSRVTDRWDVVEEVQMPWVGRPCLFC